MIIAAEQLSPIFGAKISGFDLADDLTDETFEAIRQIWSKAGGLLVFHGQKLDIEAHIAFSRRFGPLFGEPGEASLQETVSRYIHPEHPEIYRVSNIVENGQPKGRKGAGTYWHSDVSFRETPAQASILYAHEVPEVGGDTLFADMSGAYEALSEAFKALLTPLYAWHDFEVAARRQYARPAVIEADMDGANRARHPVVRTNPQSERKSLFVNPGFTSHLYGFNADESATLLGQLYGHAARPEFSHRHRWRPGDVVIWDNRSVMHYAVCDYGEAPRYLERTTVISERPL